MIEGDHGNYVTLALDQVKVSYWQVNLTLVEISTGTFF